jgi:hypothetical protein
MRSLFFRMLLGRRRYFGLYSGVVIENNDPLGRMRIKIGIPAMENFPHSWASACLPPGVESIPEIGATVWIGFEFGDHRRPVWLGMFITQGDIE